jgi:hypothetical protein
MPETLVIVPCGKRKIWDRHPDQGSMPARDAYIGAPFVVNRNYAEQMSDTWLILSAKYGFIPSDFIITGPYNVTFKRRTDDTVTIDQLREQVLALKLHNYRRIIGLGGKEYKAMVEAAFAGTGCALIFPFSGLFPPGMAMAATKAAMLQTR